MSRRVVLCGSMSAYEAILRTRARLERHGVRCLAPEPEDAVHAAMSAAAFESFKRRVSRRYLDEIRRADTGAILVVNEPKSGIANYIGANTFAEVAIAFQARKRIYLLRDLYAPYRDELVAWRAEPLRGDLEMLAYHLRPRTRQLHLVLPALPDAA